MFLNSLFSFLYYRYSMNRARVWNNYCANLLATKFVRSRNNSSSYSQPVISSVTQISFKFTLIWKIVWVYLWWHTYIAMGNNLFFFSWVYIFNIRNRDISSCADLYSRAEIISRWIGMKLPVCSFSVSFPQDKPAAIILVFSYHTSVAIDLTVFSLVFNSPFQQST